MTNMKSRLEFSQSEFDAQQLDDATVGAADEMFRRHGAIWLENAFSPGFIQSLADAYDEQYTSKPIAKLKRKHAVVGDERLMITIKIQSPFNSSDLFASPLLSPILQSLLGPGYVLSSFGSVVTFPGADAQPIHFDHPPLFESEQRCNEIPPYAITVVIPLVDIDASTGSTAIWEGTHVADGSREQMQSLMLNPSFDGSVEPRPKIGGVYFMDYRVIHGGTANRGDDARPILYLVYSRPWFHDAYNFNDQPPIKFAKGEYKNLSKDHRRLFARYRA